MKAVVNVTREIISATLNELQQAGRQGSEGMALWFGRRRNGSIDVEQVYVPEYESSSNFFWIPPAAMVALLADLRADRLIIAAQVHSHPDRAFHSAADDRWAIVRHEGALSIVLPRFAQKTTVKTFAKHAAVFELSPTNQWIRVQAKRLNEHYIILP
jgi:proteasome lid subunit RPN8/RPN11